MYFILRINKETPPGGRNTKLVLGYFGSNHVNGITFYLTEIVQTHTCPYKYMLDTTTDIQVAQVDITDNININDIMQISQNACLYNFVTFYFTYLHNCSLRAPQDWPRPQRGKRTRPTP